MITLKDNHPGLTDEELEEITGLDYSSLPAPWPEYYKWYTDRHTPLEKEDFGPHMPINTD